MKVDELLKRLENIKIDERHEIAEYVTQISSVNDLRRTYYIMTKDKKTYDISSYRELLKSNKISSNDAYVYILVDIVYNTASYYFPFLVDNYLLPYAYLSKLGFESNCSYIVPATGLKYVSRGVRYLFNNYVVVEVADIDTVATNTNLPTLIRSILGTKQIDGDEVKEVVLQLRSQKLFAGYDFDKAWEIPNRYYGNHDTSLAEEVEAIKDTYNHIFKPFRIEYDLKNKQIIASFKRKLF
jgi:hypothetical protein